MPQLPATTPVLLTSALSLDEMITFIDTVFPEINHGGRSYSIEAVGPGTCRLRLHYHPRHLRPGGTLSGPSMMALADLALYVAVLSVVGKVELAVTTNLSINFLSKPEKAPLRRRSLAFLGEYLRSHRAGSCGA